MRGNGRKGGKLRAKRKERKERTQGETRGDPEGAKARRRETDKNNTT